MKTYLVITPFFPTKDSFRGCFVYDFVKALKRTGKFERIVIFVPVNKRKKCGSIDFGGFKVCYFYYLMTPSYFFNGVLNWINKRLFLRQFKNFGFSELDVDIAHAHVSYMGALALALKSKNQGIKTLLHHHDPDPYTIRNGRLSGNWLNLLVRYYCNRCIFKKIDTHICISDFVKRQLIDFPDVSTSTSLQSYSSRLKSARYLGLKAPKLKIVEVLYNGVDTSVFFPLSKTSNNDAFVIGSVGNFVDWKDQLTLLKSLVLLKTEIANLRAVLIGTGPELDKCRDFVQNNGLGGIVKFIESASHENLNRLYNSFDIFVLPSYFEGFGCVFTEAAACGVPFFGCKGQGAMEYLSSECYDDFTISAMDYTDLAKKILRYKNGISRQDYIHEISIDGLVDKFLKSIAAQ